MRQEMDAPVRLRKGDRPSPAGGAIRAARRPPGFVPPGPRPPRDREPSPGPSEDVCHLTGDFRIYQRVDGHRWSLDDLAVAAVAADGPTPRRALDLGSGIGSVLMMVAWAFESAELIGVEAQAVSVALCRRSLWLNGLERRAEIRQGDLRSSAALPEGRVDLVTGTPPYFGTEQGVVSSHVQRGPCRFELRGGVEAYFEAADRCLDAGGRFVVCEDARQRTRVEAAAEKARLPVSARLDVVPKEDKPALFSVFTCQRVAPPAVREATLVVRDASDRFTEEFRSLRTRMGLPSR